MTSETHCWGRLDRSSAIERLRPSGLRWRSAGGRADREARPICPAGSSCRGFSLLEVLLVLALLGIAALFALPAFRVLARRAKIEGIAREIQVQLVAARHQAIKRGDDTGIEIAAGTDPATCRKFVDRDHTGTFGGGDLVLGGFQPGTERRGVLVKIDNPNVSSPSSTPAVHAMVFTGFGSANPVGTLKSVYIEDGFGNLVQISIPNAISGRVEMTKWNGSTFIPPPWTWR